MEGNRLCNERELVEGTRFEHGFPSFYFIDNHTHAALVAFGNQRRAPAEAPVPSR
jgi:hypothetical protein